MKFKFNLESKIAGLVVLLLIGVYAVQSYIDYGNMVELAKLRYQKQAEAIANTLQYSVVQAVRNNEVEVLTDIAQDIIDANAGEINQITIKVTDHAKSVMAVNDRNAEMNSVNVPVMDGTAKLADINVGFLKAPLQDYLHDSLLDKGITALLVIGVAILLTSLLSRRVTHPLAKLTEAVSKVADGDLTQKVDVTSHDEIGVLGRTFNQMTDNLKQSHGQLNEANSALEKRLKELTTLFEIDKLINSSSGVEEVLRLTIEMMSTGFGVEIGAILLKQKTGDAYEIVEGCGLAGSTMAAHRLDPEAGILAGVLTLGESLLVEDLAANAELLDGFTDDERRQISSVLIIPLKAGQKTLGVFTVYRLASGEKPDEELQNLFAIIASLIAPLIQMTILYEEKLAAVANPFEPLVERIDAELQRARKFNLPFTLARVTVTGLSAYCVAHTYAAGMTLMTKLQDCFLAEVPSAESIVRFGLNSFVLVQAGKAEEETRGGVAEVLARCVAAIPEVQDLAVRVNLSAFPDQGDEALALIDALGRD